MSLSGKVKCPYCETSSDIEVRDEYCLTVETCIKCNKWFVAEAEMNIEIKGHKIDKINKEA